MFLGNVVTAGAFIKCAPWRSQYLEMLRNVTLTRTCGDSEAILCLDERANSLIN